MHHRFTLALRYCLFFLILITAALQPQSSAYALTTLTVQPLTWNVVGLDSNDVNVGPNHFPVGVRVCNSGGESATNVTATFVWDSDDPFIDLRSGSLSSINLGTLTTGSCADGYFEVEVTRNSNAYDHTRDYHINVTAGNVSGTISTPTPREIYVEHLISQSRNAVTDVQLNGASVAAGGTMTLMVGQTYEIKLAGFTATQGYEQIEYFINFPNIIFQILSVSSTFNADTSATVGPSPISMLYGDNCVWDNDPNSPTYRACLSTGKTGGLVTTTYQVKILQVPGAPLVNPQPLSTLIYDFSGSSFHYNSDYGVSTRYANIVNASVTKAFSPKTILPGGTSTLTFRINNPGTSAISGLNFTDDLPAGMTLANDSVNYSGCGAASPAAVSDPLSFSNITIAGSGTCTIAVTVTAAANGTYNNTSGNLFLGTTNTGSSASDSLVVSSQPPPPNSCSTRSNLATWTFENYTASTSTNSGPFSASSLPGTGVTAGQGTFGSSGASTSAITSPTIYPDAAWGNNLEPSTTGNSGNSWGIHAGWLGSNPANATTATTPYFQFRVDGASNYGAIGITLNYNLQGNWSNAQNWYVIFSSDGTNWTSPTGNFAVWNNSNSWQAGGITVNTTTSAPTVYFRVFAAGAQNSTATMYVDSVNVTGCKRPSVPTLSKSFSPTTIARGSASTLSFTFTNPNSTSLSAISFSDTLPTGLVIDTPNGLSAISCSSDSVVTTPTITAAAGTSVISMSGLQLSANASCSFSVSVKGNTAGAYTNISESITSTSSGPNTTSTGYGTGSLTVIDPPVLAKSFNVNPISTGDTALLDFDIANPNASTALTGVTFTDVLPAGLLVADGAFSVCGGTNNLITTTAARTITLLDSTTIAAGGTCSFSVTVTGSTAGSYTNTTGNISSGNGGTGNIATANFVVKTPSPAINLLKQVGPSATGPWTAFINRTVGSDVYYRFTVENTGDVSLANVSVDDPTVSTASCSWTRGDIATPVNSPFTLQEADAANNHIATCILGPVSAVSGLHINTATASGTSGTTVTKSSSATYGTPAITIVKSVTETSFSAAGDVLHYSYLVTNSGSAPLLGPVTVADDKATVACPAVNTVGDGDGWLEPANYPAAGSAAESLTCTATYTVTATDVSNGFVTNTASATVNGITSTPDSETVNGTADLASSKNNAVTSVVSGGTTTYTIRVTNNGPSSVNGAVLSDPAVVGLTKTAVACSATPGQCTAGTTPTVAQLESGTFALPTLISGQFYEINVTATVIAANGSLTNTATVAPPAGGTDPNPTNNTASDTDTVAPAPDLTVSKTNNAANGWVASGGAFQWTITARNGANAGTASFANGDVILSDALPAGQTYGAVTFTNGVPAPTGTINCSITGTTLSCVANGAVTFPADASFTAIFNVTTSGNANLPNTATIDPDNRVNEINESNNTGWNTVYVFDGRPSKLLVTTSEPSTNASRVTLGEMVRYRIAARIPESDFANFQLVDNIPSGLQYVNDGMARFTFVSNGAGVTSSTLTCVNDTGDAFDLVSLNSTNVDCALTGAISGGTGNGVPVTFSLGNISNADVDADAEYAVVEFNALVLNVNTSTDINQGVDNQTGALNNNFRPNDATLRVNNAAVGLNSTNVTVNIAEPAITNAAKSVSAGPYLPANAVTYTLTFSNVSSTLTNAATAFDIVLTDTLNANLTPGAVNVSSTQAGACLGGTVFTTSASTNGQDVTVNISCLDPDQSVTVTINATINGGTAGGTNISNTGNVTYSSLPGAQGSCSASPFTCGGVGNSGTATGERTGFGGAGADISVLNNYSDSGTVSFTVASADLLPVAVLDTNTAIENGPAVNGEVLTNETSLGNTPTTVTASDQGGTVITLGSPFTTAAGGSLTLNANGTYSYIPPALLAEGSTLTEVFNYTITDVDGDTSSTTLTITVDRLPQANPDTNSATEGGANATGNVITNDDEGNTNAAVTLVVDDDGDPLVVGNAFLTDGGGSLTINADGSYTYTPPAINLVPPVGLIEVFTYTITDNDGDTSSTTLTITVNDGDQLPDAVADTNTATENGSAVNGNLLTNENSLGDTPTTVTTAVDDDGDALTLGVPFTTDGGGTLTINSNGTYSYTPPVTLPEGGMFSEVFTYTITDVDGDTDTATLTITVDRLPLAVANTGNATEGGPATAGNVITNDDEGNISATVTAANQAGTPITIGSAFTTPAGGTLTLNSSGDYTYVPPATLPEGGSLTELFNYTIADADGDTSSTTLTITVDRLPQANPDTNTATEGGPNATGNIVTNDDEGNTNATISAADQGGTAITIGSAFTTAAGGTLTLNADGTYTYTPPATLPEGAVLTEVFNYTLRDKDGDRSSSTLTITVDRLPQAVPDTNTATEGGPNATGNVVTNDDEGNTSATVTTIVDDDGDPLTIGVPFTTDGGGTLTLNGNGSYTYTPPVFGTIPPGGLSEVFTYTITDADGDTSTSTLTITVNDNDRLPDAVADINSATEGGADAAGNLLTNENSLGDTPTTVTAIADDDGNPLTLGTPFATDGGGSLTINADGTYTYTPPASLPEGDLLIEVFTYTITDVDGDTDTATLTITVDRLPEANPDTNSATEGGADVTGNVITNDDEGNLNSNITVADQGGSTITIGKPYTTAAGGSLTLNGDGTYTYTPPATLPEGAVLTEEFNYTITDADGDTSSSTLTITVDRLPQANPDTNTATEGGANAAGNVINNDDEGNVNANVTAANQGGSSITIGLAFTTAAGGSLTIHADGGYTYTPPAINLVPPGGVTEVFNYTIADNDGDISSSTLTITVDDNDQVPVAVADTNTATENGAAVNGNVLTNDSLGDAPTTVTSVVDDDGNPLTLGTPFATDGGGSLTINADGTYSYIPPAWDLVPPAGLAEVFTYTITDVDGDTDTTTLTITVNDDDRLPLATDNSYTINEGATVIGNVMTDGTPDTLGDPPATVTAYDSTGVNGGTVTIAADGSFTYDPNGFVGTDTFTYTITDKDGDVSTATVTVTITDLPDAIDDSDTTGEGTPVTTDVLINDDLGTPSTTITAHTDGSNGSVSCAATDCTYIPDAGFVGTDTYTYTITDANGNTDTATVTITVTDLPDAINDSDSTDEGTPVTTNVLTNDDLGVGPTTITSHTQGTNGAVTCTASNCTYTPGSGFTGTDTYTYTITDANGNADTATVTILVVDLPDAIDDSDTTDEGTPVTTNVLTNDDPGAIPTTITSHTQGTNGSVACTATNCTYTPAPGFTGTDTYTYTITDANGNTDTATVTITIVDLPDAVNDSDTTDENTPVTTNVLTNDDLGTAPTTITSNTDGTNGSVTCTAGDCTYTPDPGFAGTDTYTYTITDANGNSDTATVTITVDLSRIGIAKRIVSTTEVTSGTYDVTYDLYVENFGSTALNNIQITDNLSTTFAAPTTFTVRSLTSDDFTVNAGYNGSSDTNLLAGADSLAAGANGNITLVVRVVPAGAGPFNNVAIASGQCPTCNTPVTDQSQDGSDPDPDHDDDPTNDNDPTPLTFGPNLFDPPFGLKVVDASGIPLLQWTMVWINDSNIVAIDAQVADPIPAGTSFVAGSLTCTASGVTTTNSCFYELPSATYPRGRVIWNGDLGPDLNATDAASAGNEITITFNVNVSAGITSVQNTATIDADLNGNNVLTDPGEQIVASATSSWSVASTASNRVSLPATGFAPHVVTDLRSVPHESYTAAGDVSVEIPGLNIKLPIVGVPKKDGTWNVSWLGNQAGWLEGTAFPSWSGNSVLTSHVYLSNGLPGPFINLAKLKYGDKIVIHAYGQKYTFEVRENKIVEPNDQTVMKHEDKSWLTLITCKEYDPKTNTYLKRVVVRAVLVSVAGE